MDLTPGNNGEYPGGIQFGVAPGGGPDFYDDLVAAMNSATALRPEYVKLFQGG